MLPSPDLRQIYAALRQKIHLSSCPNFPGQLSFLIVCGHSIIARAEWHQVGWVWVLTVSLTVKVSRYREELPIPADFQNLLIIEWE
jgi:hypothetical protein